VELPTLTARLPPRLLAVELWRLLREDLSANEVYLVREGARSALRIVRKTLMSLLTSMRQSQSPPSLERYADLGHVLGELQIFDQALPQPTQSDKTSRLVYSNSEMSLGSIVGCKR